MSNLKLSFSRINTYKECPKKYYLRYEEELIPNETKSSLVFGKCVDEGLNELMVSRNLEASILVFEKSWGEFKDKEVKYTKSDYDEDLISYNLTETNRPWFSMYKKGIYILKAFNEEILPRIKKTVLVQKIVEAHCEDGDTIVGALDAIVEWEDGKTYLIDNKTTSIKYTENSANESEQLALYHFLEKDNYKLDGVAFFTLNKILKKLNIKKCLSCGEIHKGTQLKTCNMLIDEKKCGGALDKTYEFSVETKVIFGKPSEEIEDKILHEFDKASFSIKKKLFDENPNSCIGKYGKCEYYAWCRHGYSDGYIKKNNKPKESV